MNFVRTTILGGIIFLLPLVVIFAVVSQGMQIVHRLAEPLLAAVGVGLRGGC